MAQTLSARTSSMQSFTDAFSGPTNVGDVERLACTVGGAVLTLVGLERGTLGGLALAFVGGGLMYRGVTGHCPMYARLGMNTSEQTHSPAASVPASAGFKIEETMTINKSPEDLYRFWRQLHNLPRFMRHLKSVTVHDSKRSHWVAQGPAGSTVEWDAEVINERPNEMIAWRSLPGADVDNAGSVHFQPTSGGQGTELRVTLKYNPPAGKLGGIVARVFGEAPEQQIREDLQRFKEMMESGSMGGSEQARGPSASARR